MDLNRLTEKAQEAILAAQRLAEEHHNTLLEPEHLLAALLDQRSGVVPSLLERLGLGPRAIRQQLEAEIDRLPRGLRDRLADRKISLELTENARNLLALQGFDPIYGARPLKRVIQKEIVQPLAMRLLNGEFVEGDTVVVDALGEQIVFKRKEITRAAGEAT